MWETPSHGKICFLLGFPGWFPEPQGHQAASVAKSQMSLQSRGLWILGPRASGACQQLCLGNCDTAPPPTRPHSDFLTARTRSEVRSPRGHLNRKFSGHIKCSMSQIPH